MSIQLSLRYLRLGLFAMWTALVLGGLWAELWKAVVGRHTLRDWVYFFGLSYEQNLPTWYSASLLLLCAVALLLIAIHAFHQRRTLRWHWLFLAIVFAYISLDETATLHERLSEFFDFGGVLFFGWVIPAGVAVLLVGLAYLPMLARLPAKTRTQFILAGSIYVGGALGVELLLGWWTDYAGSTQNLTYGLIDLVEESMEIMGVTLFLLALIELLAGDDGVVRLRVDGPS